MRARLISSGCLFVPAVLAAILYLPLRNDFFLSDDFDFLLYATQVPVTETAWIPEPGSAWYRPIPLATWRLNFLLFGSDPEGYRATNLILHVVNAVLVAGLAMRVQASAVAGLIAGAFFALQPRGTGAVAWLSGRFDLTATLFVLVAVHACISSYRTRTWAWRVLGIGATCAALASKESAVAAPLLLLALASRRLCRLSGFDDRCVHRLDAAVACVVVAAYLALRIVFMGGLGGYGTHGRLELVQLLNPLLALPAVLHGFGPLSPAEAFVPWLGLSCIVGGVLARAAPVGLLWAVGAILPAANHYWPATMFWEIDRFLYLAAAGMALAVSTAWWRLSGQSRWATAFVTMLLVCLLSINVAYTSRRVAAWHEAAELTRRVHDLLLHHRATIPDGAVIDCAALPDNLSGAYTYRTGCNAQIALVWPDGRVRGIYSSKTAERASFSIQSDGRVLPPVP